MTWRIFLKAGIGVLALSLLTPSSKAEPAPFTLNEKGVLITIEPIVGYEFDHSTTPNVHVRGMLLYGARATAGYRILSAEAEVTEANSNEAFASPTETLQSQKYNVRLGILTTAPIFSSLSATARLGGQASRLDENDSITGKTQGKWLIHPYAGVGLNGGLTKYLSVSANASYVFNDLAHWNQNDIQLSFSVKYHLN